jgi:hypothetical protein
MRGVCRGCPSVSVLVGHTSKSTWVGDGKTLHQLQAAGLPFLPPWNEILCYGDLDLMPLQHDPNIAYTALVTQDR